MTAGPNGPCDWRSPQSYRALADMDRAGLAWEWLRRDERYAASASKRGGKVSFEKGVAIVRSTPASRSWGLDFRRKRALARDKGLYPVARFYRSRRFAGAGEFRGSR